MPASVPIVPSQVNPVPAAKPTASDPTTAGAAAMSNTPVVTANSPISSLAQFRREAPQVYNMMMQTFMESCRQDMQRHADNLKKAMRGN